MKCTGIIRRVDDLGRIVIPKEIRRQLHIREGDPLELYIDGDDIVWKKYSPLHLGRYVDCAAAVLGRNGLTYAIYDCERIISTNDTNTFLVNSPLSWDGRRDIFEVDSITVFPIIHDGELIGHIAVINADGKANIVTIVIQMMVAQMSTY